MLVWVVFASTIYRYLGLPFTHNPDSQHTDITPPSQTLAQSPSPPSASYTTDTTVTQIKTHAQHFPLLPPDW